MGFPKMSMLAFYWAYFLPSTGMSSVMRKSLYGITAFVCISYMVILWDDTFFCGKDVSVQWSMEEGACSVFYAPEPFILNFTLNLACYIAGMFLSKRFSLLIFANHRVFSLCSPSHPAPPRCSASLQGCHSYVCSWCLDYLHHRREIHHPQGRHRTREPRL